MENTSITKNEIGIITIRQRDILGHMNVVILTEKEIQEIINQHKK